MYFWCSAITVDDFCFFFQSIVNHRHKSNMLPKLCLLAIHRTIKKTECSGTMWTMWLVISNTRSPEVITAEDPQPGIDNEEASRWRRREEGQTVTTPQLFTELITLFQTSMTLASGNNGFKMHIQESLWLKKKGPAAWYEEKCGLNK